MPGAAMSVRGRHLSWQAAPVVAGILNATPDSFYAPSRILSAGAAERAQTLVAEGAGMLDVGALSSRPGSAAVPADVELERLLPVLREVRAAVDVPISVDTYEPRVARAALEAGADLINDITGLSGGDEIAALAARYDGGLILMHMRGTPTTMQDDTAYDDLLGEVAAFLTDAAERAVAAGVSRGRIVLDPGIGFGKDLRGNLELLRRTGELAALGYPVLIGASRKSFIGEITGQPAGERLAGSIGAALEAARQGAAIVRVHDVRPTVDALRVAGAIRDDRSPS